MKRTVAMHGALACLALLAVWLMMRVSSGLDSFTLVVLVYTLAEGAWAVAAFANQRQYKRDPRRPAVNELRGLFGGRGVVTRACDPRGQVRVDGELWQAEASGGISIPEGAQVLVRRADSLVLEVEPCNEDGPMVKTEPSSQA